MVPETKLDESFSEGQSLIEGFIRYLDLTVIEMVDELCFTYQQMISQLNCQVMISLLRKSFLLTSTFIKRKGLLTVPITPTRVT